MPAGFEAGSDDRIHAGLLKGCSLFWCCCRTIVTMLFARHSSKLLVAEFQRIKLNTGTFASSKTRT